jgi:hypothetical protein
VAMSEVDLESLETQCRDCRAQQPPELGRVGTHWTGCWTVHPFCALPIVEELVKTVREAGRRQVTLDRIIVEATRGSGQGWDAEQQAELDRIGRVWSEQDHR